MGATRLLSKYGMPYHNENKGLLFFYNNIKKLQKI